MGAAINNRATEKTGQLNETGRTLRRASTPLSATRNESAINRYKASAAPVKFRTHAFSSELVSRRWCGQALARVPHKIISSATETGASTGPHHGSGRRNRMSQSSSERGQPQSFLRKT